MGRISARFQTSVMTVWPVTYSDDGYNTEVYGDPFLLKCEYSQQQKSVVDDSGVQFIPSWTFHVSAVYRDYVPVTYDSSLVYYDGALILYGVGPESIDPGSVLRGNYAVLGDYSAEAEPIDGAKPIRTVRVMQNIRGQSPDVTVYCG